MRLEVSKDDSQDGTSSAAWRSSRLTSWGPLFLAVPDLLGSMSDGEGVGRNDGWLRNTLPSLHEIYSQDLTVDRRPRDDGCPPPWRRDFWEREDRVASKKPCA